MRSHSLIRSGVRVALLTLLACVLAAGSISAAPAGAGTTTTHYVLRGSQADGFWFLDDPDGCSVTLLDLASFTNVVVSGQSNAVPYVRVIYDKVNHCTGTELSGLAFQDIPANANQVEGPDPYMSASLSPTMVSVPLTDANGVPGPTLNLTVSGTWTSTEVPAPFQSITIESAMAPGLHTEFKSLERFVDATATATVMLGSTNLTPQPSADGDAIIDTQMNGSLTITK
jgi:hypothetical protein